MNKVSKVMIVSSVTNICLSIIKIVFGTVGKCSALISDGIHSFSDLSTDLVAIIGTNLSNKESDEEHPFGHGKIEYITSIMIGMVIIIVGLLLINSTFKKEIVTPNLLIGIVSLFTITAKYILSNYIYKKGKIYKNNILIASAQESKADVYSSIFVLISIILMQFSSYINVLKYSDKIGSIIISFFIIKAGYNILKDNISNLLEKKVVDEELIKQISKIVLNNDEVLEIKSLYLFKYGPYYRLMCEIVMNKDITLALAHEKVDEIEKAIKHKYKKIKYIFIHMEPNV